MSKYNKGVDDTNSSRTSNPSWRFPHC